MQVLASYARSTFWTIGIVQILLGLYLGVTAALSHQPASRPRAAAIVLFLGFLNVAMGSWSCLAAWAWRRQARFARLIVAVNSVFSLVLIPFGTVAGLAGLYWCCSRRMRQSTPLAGDFEHESKPEDGTHAWVQKAIPVLSVLIWLASFGAANWWARTQGLTKHVAINGLLVLFLSEWIAVLCHEFGHALAGWAASMTLVSMRVGPFVAMRKAGRWKLQFSWPSILAMGGAVVTIPTHLTDLRRRMAFEIAGGPVASVLTALIAFSALLAVPGSPWEAWWQVPAMITAISAGAAVLNLIPFGFAAGYSDGALLLQLLRGGRFADLRETMKMVGTTLITDTRPRDLDAGALANGFRAGMGSPEEGTLQMIQLICAVDRGELGLARQCLESSLRRIPAPEKASGACSAAEMAFYMAYLDGNADRAGEWLRGAEQLAVSKKTPLAQESDYWRALTAVREAEGQSRQAEEAYRQAVEFLAKKPATGLYQFERELLETVMRGGWVRVDESALREATA